MSFCISALSQWQTGIDLFLLFTCKKSENVDLILFTPGTKHNRQSGARILSKHPHCRDSTLLHPCPSNHLPTPLATCLNSFDSLKGKLKDWSSDEGLSSSRAQHTPKNVWHLRTPIRRTRKNSPALGGLQCLWGFLSDNLKERQITRKLDAISMELSYMSEKAHNFFLRY